MGPTAQAGQLVRGRPRGERWRPRAQERDCAALRRSRRCRSATSTLRVSNRCSTSTTQLTARRWVCKLACAIAKSKLFGLCAAHTTYCAGGRLCIASPPGDQNVSVCEFLLTGHMCVPVPHQTREWWCTTKLFPFSAKTTHACPTMHTCTELARKLEDPNLRHAMPRRHINSL